MISYLLRRVLTSVGVLLVASFLLYVLVATAGNPLAELAARPGVTPEQVRTVATSLGLDRPVPVRYVGWLGGVLTGDWGTSVALGQDRAEVLPTVARALGVTVRLVVAAEVLALVVGGALGALAALRHGSALDHAATVLALVLFSTPVFCLAVVLKTYGIAVNDVLASLGIGRWLTTAGPPPGGFGGTPGQVVFRVTGTYVLPTLTLAAVGVAAYSRLQRASMLETLHSDYVRTARAKGLTDTQVVLRHALRTALVPVTTYFGVQFGVVFGGAVVTEQVFGWNGMGTLLVRSVRQYDPDMLMGWLLVTATLVIVANLLADVVHGYLDPRIRGG